MADSVGTTTVTTEKTTSTSTATASVNNTTQSKTEQEESKVTEETYPIKNLIDNCKALGYKKEVVAGALFNCEKTEITKTELKIKIKDFLGKAVK